MEKKNRNIRRNCCTIYIVCILGVLAVCGICMFALPQRTYSQEENRYLTTMPKVTREGVLSGETQQALSDAAADQFPLRDGWTHFAMCCRYLMCKREANGVYIGADGQLFEKKIDSDLSLKNYCTNLQYITTMAADSGADVSVMLIPSAGTVLSAQLPTRAVLYDPTPYEEAGAQQCEAESVRWVQTKDDLARVAHDGARAVYFHTDHHWTTYGAYVGARTYLQTRHRQTADLSEYDVQTVSEDFRGTLYSKIAGFPQVESDVLELPMRLPSQLRVESDGAPADAVSADGSHKKPQLSGIYDLSKLEQKDKYAVYFGGNYGSLTITNPEAEGGGRLLLIKDSYANSMVPYLCDSYGQITMIDLRYYNGSMPHLVAEGWDDILVCYEMSNFIAERNIFKLIR